MLELVLWSWLLAIAPWTLGLAGKLFSGALGLISPRAPAGSVGHPRSAACPGKLLRPVTELRINN
jgi:hypothetical protein